MKKYATYISALLLAATLSFGPTAQAASYTYNTEHPVLIAKGSSFRSGGFRSSRPSYSSKPSSSKPSASKPSSWNKKNTSNTTKAKAPARSAAQQAAYEKASKNGKAFTSKSAAVNDFKAKNASKYTNKYATQPSVRPSYIPQTYKGANGATYNVTYNQMHGGYGYYGPSGAWIMYDVMRDAVMLNMLMSHQGYYYDTHRVNQNQVVHHSSGIGVLMVFLAIIAILVVVVVVVRIS